MEPCSVCSSTDNIAYLPHLLRLEHRAYCGECRAHLTEHERDIRAHLQSGKDAGECRDLTVYTDAGQRVGFREWYQLQAQEE